MTRRAAMAASMLALPVLLGAAGRTHAAEFDCLIEPAQVVEVRSPVVGILQQVHARRGEFVAKGAVLVTIESSVEKSAADAARYRSQALGILWSLLNPLVQMTILTVIFSHVDAFKSAIPSYPVYLLIGVVLWQWFSTGINTATQSFITHADIVKRTVFPRQLLPVSMVASNGVTARFLEIIDKHANRLTLLIDDLLLLARLDSGRIELNLRPFPCIPPRRMHSTMRH